MSGLESPKNWVEAGKETKEARDYMKKLKELKKDVFAKLETDMKAQMESGKISRNNFDMPLHTVKEGESLGSILKNNVGPFRNKDLLLYSLTYMSVEGGKDVNSIHPGEKVSIEDGRMKIVTKADETRMEYTLLPWDRMSAPRREQSDSTQASGQIEESSTDTGNNDTATQTDTGELRTGKAHGRRIGPAIDPED